MPQQNEGGPEVNEQTMLTKRPPTEEELAESDRLFRSALKETAEKIQKEKAEEEQAKAQRKAQARLKKSQKLLDSDSEFAPEPKRKPKKRTLEEAQPRPKRQEKKSKKEAPPPEQTKVEEVVPEQTTPPAGRGYIPSSRDETAIRYSELGRRMKQMVDEMLEISDLPLPTNPKSKRVNFFGKRTSTKHNYYEGRKEKTKAIWMRKEYIMAKFLDFLTKVGEAPHPYVQISPASIPDDIKEKVEASLYIGREHAHDNWALTVLTVLQETTPVFPEEQLLVESLQQFLQTENKKNASINIVQNFFIDGKGFAENAKKTVGNMSEEHLHRDNYTDLFWAQSLADQVMIYQRPFEYYLEIQEKRIKETEEAFAVVEAALLEAFLRFYEERTMEPEDPQDKQTKHH
jgi:hypothetical protein